MLYNYLLYQKIKFVLAQAAAAAKESSDDGGAAAVAAAEDDTCVICQGPPVDPEPLPCGHAYCRECLVGLRTKGVAQTCPLCRAELPPGVAGLFDMATRAYRRVAGRVARGEAAWESLDDDAQEEMDEAVAMLTEAVAQGHGGGGGGAVGGPVDRKSSV